MQPELCSARYGLENLRHIQTQLGNIGKLKQEVQLEMLIVHIQWTDNIHLTYFMYFDVYIY